MSIRSRNSLISGVTWLLIITVLVLMFFQGDSVDEWGYNGVRRLVSAIAILLGIVVNTVMLSKNKKEPLDERSRAIQYRTSTYSLQFCVTYAFVLCMVLFLIYEKSESVPVSWLWFIAYTTFTLTFMLGSFLYFFLDRKGITYED
jgi:archaellum biogenesis protein FlaJ (TadC family)